MRIDFRQGIVRHPTDAYDNQTFLVVSNSKVTLDVTAANPALITFAHGDTDYLITESTGIQYAWEGPDGGFVGGTDYWLYWDIDLRTGQRSFGYTEIPPTSGPNAPQSPATDQHWFDTSRMIMRVWTGAGWTTRVRVFAAKLEQGNVIKPMGSDGFRGTQVGNSSSTYAGALVFDMDGYPIQRKHGQFFTTEDAFVSGISSSALMKLGPVVLQAEAAANMAAYTVVKFSDDGTIEPAHYLSPENVVFGVIEEDVVIGDYVHVVLEGIVRNENWNFSKPNKFVYVTDTNGTVGTTHVSQDQVPIGVTVDSYTFVMRSARVVVNNVDAVNKVTKAEDTTEYGIVRLNTAPANQGDPIAVGPNDPLVTDKYTTSQIDSMLSNQDQLGELGDVTLSSVADGEFLYYNNSTGQWENHIPVANDISDFTQAAQDAVGVTWLDPVELVSIVDHELLSPPADPVFADTYFVSYGSGTNWPTDGSGGYVPEGHLAQFNGQYWNDIGSISAFPSPARYGVSFVSSTTASGTELSGHDNEIVTVYYCDYDIAEIDLVNNTFTTDTDCSNDFSVGNIVYVTGSADNNQGYEVSSVTVNQDGSTTIGVVDTITSDTTPYGTIYRWRIAEYYSPSDQDAVWVRNTKSLYAFNQYVYNANEGSWSQFGGTQTIEAGTNLEFIGSNLNVLNYDQGGTINASTLRGNTPLNFDNKYVFVNGDTLTGYLTLHADPSDNLHAATKQYVDSADSNIRSNHVSLSGDTLTGYLTLHDDPTDALHAATKQYVDDNAGGPSVLSDLNDVDYGITVPTTLYSYQYLMYDDNESMWVNKQVRKDLDFWYSGQPGSGEVVFVYAHSSWEGERLLLPNPTNIDTTDRAVGKTINISNAPSDGDVTLEIFKNDALVGSITFPQNTSTAGFTLNEDVVLYTNDVLHITAPSTQDSSFGNFAISIVGRLFDEQIVVQ